MNKFILTVLLFIISYKGFSNFSNPNSFNGSVLCDTLSTTYQIPGEFQGTYKYHVEVLKSDTA